MKQNFMRTYIIFVIVQILLTNYLHVSPYLVLNFLPVLVFCIPTRVSSFLAMLIAFASGLAVDYFAEGTLGINTLAILPVAYLREPLIRSFFGSEPFEQKSSVSISQHGAGRVVAAVFLEQGIFMLLYVLADCAGTRPAWFVLIRFAVSLVVSGLVSLVVMNFVSHDDR